MSILALLYWALAANANGTKDFCQDYIAAKRFLDKEKIYKILHCHDADTDYNLTYNMHPPLLFSFLFR